MKNLFLALAALVILSSAPAVAQIVSSPLEPGVYDYLMSNGASRIELVSDKKMIVSRVTVELVSDEQMTLKAEVTRLEDASFSQCYDLRSRIGEYNVNGAVGTMSVEGASVVLVHHLNPRLSNVGQLANAIERFSKTADEQARQFDVQLACR